MIDRLDAYHFYEHEWESYDRLHDWFEWEIPERFNAAAYLCDRWTDDEDRVALYAEDATGTTATYTFRDLQAVANRLANYLSEQGVKRGDRVGVNAPQRPETLVTHVACWKLGAVSVPLSTLFGPDGIGYRLDDAGAVAAVVAADNIDNFREARESLDGIETVLTVGNADCRADEQDFWETIDEYDSEFETVDTHAEDDLILIYTSGTTGDPKGVRHVHRTVLGHLPLFVTAFANMDLCDGDVFWTPSEWAWIASLFDVVVPALYYGMPVVAYEGGKFDPEDAFRVLDEYDVTNAFIPPTALRMMMQVDDTDRFAVDAVRTITSGGESLGQNIVDWAADVFEGAAVHEAYGQTEANITIGDCTALFPFKEGTIGRPGPGHEVTIVDEDTAEPIAEPGVVGEIAVRYEDDPVCFVEYWNEPDKTDRKVQNGWLLTEDLGRMDEEGYVTFESRKDDVIICSGYRIGPEEVEDSISGHEAVADAGVIGVPDDERGEVPKAFVVRAEGYEPSEELRDELKTHVRNRLAKYEYPRRIEFIDDLPTTSTGKLRRASLRERDGLQ